MARSLVIVESPAKARTINRYLGKGYIVKSSIGHVRDLPTGKRGADAKPRVPKGGKAGKAPPAQREKQARQQLIRRMGVNPDAGWTAEYEVLPGKEKVVGELSRLAKTADAVYLATDLDREGEAIAWHLQETIGGEPGRYRRVLFNEITRKAIRAAFETPGSLDMNRVNAQQARRFLDRVVGFELSPLLWAKVARGLSAGRVQSVAVRLIVEREREIRAFKPEEYWELFADLLRAGEGETLRFQVVKEGGKNFRPGNKTDAAAAEARLRECAFAVRSREERPTRSRPYPPLITSTLQQAGSARLGFNVKKTMQLAQRLYEAGLITYMRTDSTNLSGEAIGACRKYIGEQFGDRYLPARARVYASKGSAQEAHEAIRPTNVARAPGKLSGIDADAIRLYDLIRRQFIACQMPDAEYLATTVLLEAGAFELRIRGRVVLFDGHTRVLPPASQQAEDPPLPDLKPGEALELQGLESAQHFTKPPPRYSEASLVRELEKRGIGRPSTYAAIISTIQERGYVVLVKRRFQAAKIGELVTDRLVEKFENLMDYGFTARMEQELDRVAGGELGWKSVLDEFYGDFSGKLAAARADFGGLRPNEPTETDLPCVKCGRPMQIRTAGSGVFLGCSGYSLAPKERCTATLNLVPGDEAVDIERDEEGESKLLRSKRKCPKCGTPMTAYLLDAERKLHICGNNPDCPGFVVETGQFRIKGYEGPVLECDKCSAEMQLKQGRFGKYFGCTRCKNTRKLLRNGQPAPPKADPIPMPELRCKTVDDYYLLRDGASGMFLAASGFPKHRETRAPLVRELLPHANELDPKFKYLLSAPAEDPNGAPTVVRFSRKTRQHYVQTEMDGKPTGWCAWYKKGAWVEQTAPAGKKHPAAKRKAPARKAAAGAGKATATARKAPASAAKTSASARKAPAKRKAAGRARKAPARASKR